jgi:hypothetical protein
MNNPEILVTLDTQDIGRKQTKRKKEKTTQKTKKISSMDPTTNRE